MLCEDAPKCLCGSHNWSPGGANIGGGMSQQWMTCKDCSRPICILFAYYCGCVFQHRDYPSTKIVGEGENARLETGNEINGFTPWLNETLLVTFRAHGEKVEAAQQAIWEREWQTFCEDRKIPKGTRLGDLHHDGQLYKDGCNLYEAILKREEYHAARGDTPTPPNIPEKMHLRLCRGNEFILVETKDSLAIELPPDPIRVHHDQYYLPIFAKLGITDFELIPNEYCGATNEPWYRFVRHAAVFKVGPRKRVTSITVHAPGLNVERISRVAQKDNTTYYVDGGWQPWEHQEIKEWVGIHAWSKEKVEEYLTILLEEAGRKLSCLK